MIKIDEKEMKKILLILLVGLSISGCGNQNVPQQNSDTNETSATVIPLEEKSTPDFPLNIEETVTVTLTSPPAVQPRIILYIGDGMGSEHRLAGQYYAVGEVRQLAMDALPVSGWLVTDSYGGQLTESAAAATALATGYQTNNDIISLDIEGKPLKTILEYAQDLGMAVGIVSNKFVTDATTAAFAAHVGSNAQGPEVASQFLEHRVDVIFGGGENDFLPRGFEGCHPENGKRTDGRNLIEEAEETGYTIVCDRQSFDAIDPQTDVIVLGLFADENMSSPNSPSLAEMTRTAIEILSLNPNGYFLVVEGAMIDIVSHFAESQQMIDEVIGLDEAVKVGVEFAEIDENMLIIVTADHETGGLTVNLTSSGVPGEEGPFEMPNTTEFFISWKTGEHTFANIPVTAMGRGSEKLFGLHENTVVFDVMAEFLGVAGRGE